MLLVVMAEQHFPDRTAIALVKQAENAPPFVRGETQNENAESPINITPNGIANSVASAKGGINVDSISGSFLIGRDYRFFFFSFFTYFIVMRMNESLKIEFAFQTALTGPDIHRQYDFIHAFHASILVSRTRLLNQCISISQIDDYCFCHRYEL